MEPIRVRVPIIFHCADDQLLGTIDQGAKETGLLIVSGGNELRCGAYGGQAALAATFAGMGYPVFRYDRRGIGDSEGENRGFDNSAMDIAAAVAAFRSAAPHIRLIVAFGNCDAASALALYGADLGIDMFVLANPWVIETDQHLDGQSAVMPNASAIRSRYLARLKNPRSIADLVTGKINIRKLVHGMAKASKKDTVSGLATRIAAALAGITVPVHIVIAQKDNTAQAFLSAWHSDAFAALRGKPNICLNTIDSGSHSFADPASNAWLREQLSAALRTLA
jgi:exosortase A-associated hydrolase 1